MARQTNRAVGNKFGNLLGGLLGGLYAGSSAEPNSEFLPPGQEGPSGPNGNQPFKSGGGLFGGIKAKQENTDYAMHNLLASAASNRQLQNQISLMPYQNEQHRTQLQQAQDIGETLKEKNLGEEGATSGQFLGSLPTEQLSNIIPPTQTFGSPQEQQRYINSVYGDKTNLNQLPILADPRTKSANQSEAIGKGLVPLGEARANLDTNTVYNNAKTEHTQELVPIFETKTVLNPTTGELEQRHEIKGYKQVTTPINTPAGITNLKDMRMTPEIVAATSIQPGGNFSSFTAPDESGGGEYLNSNAEPYKPTGIDSINRGVFPKGPPTTFPQMGLPQFQGGKLIAPIKQIESPEVTAARRKREADEAMKSLQIMLGNPPTSGSYINR